MPKLPKRTLATLSGKGCGAPSPCGAQRGRCSPWSRPTGRCTHSHRLKYRSHGLPTALAAAQCRAVPPVRVGFFDRVRIEHLDELPRVFAEQLLHKAARKLWSSLSCFSTLWRVGDHWFTNHQLCERLCTATAIVHCTMMRACACLDALLRKPHCRLDLLLGQPLRRGAATAHSPHHCRSHCFAH